MDDATKKIRIIGSVASGKTTLAKELSEYLHIPYIEMDNLVWDRGGGTDRRRTPQERDACLHQVLVEDQWILEGVHRGDWTEDTFFEADVVLMLDPPYMLRTWRIIRRFFRQKAGLESANYRPSLKIFLRMFRWNRHFEKVEKRKFLQSEAGLLPKTKRVTRWSGDLENLDSLVRRRDMG
ncbi:adenylate kinase [Halobacillus sp. BAB-2008]|uniref:adenylate kinase n=1 Tax=Halobacillus sp. BAB-2008 TaxID=1246484 RepID=UPI0002A4FCB2|nr:adenylate kinase [Halobacillus sp. BAB-2008]ELK46009.1 adenylate kinase [Halobacillus sp. BAB-2008]